MLGASRTSQGEARGRLSQLADSMAEADLQKLSEDLFAVAELLARQLPLRRSLADASTAEPAKSALVSALLRERVGAPALDFVTELVGLRWSRPRDLADAVETLAVLASFEQANALGELDDVEDQLFRFGRIVERDTGLRDALSDEAVPSERKRELLAGLLGAKVGAVALRVITAATVASGGRRHVGEALDRDARLAAELRERLNARVTVAAELDDGQLDRLAAELSRVYGKRIGLRVEVDPEILGGVVVRVGDQVLDGSVARRLDIARRGLTSYA